MIWGTWREPTISWFVAFIVTIEVLRRLVGREFSHYLQANSQMSSIQTNVIIRKGSILHMKHHGSRLLGFPKINIMKYWYCSKTGTLWPPHEPSWTCLFCLMLLKKRCFPGSLRVCDCTLSTRSWTVGDANFLIETLAVSSLYPCWHIGFICLCLQKGNPYPLISCRCVFFNS